jgi:hypothetical protein
MPAKRTETQSRPRKPAAPGRKKSSAAAAPSPIVRDILARTRTPGFQRYLRDLLVELCRIDTTPNPEVKRMQAAEDGCFRILERELGGLDFCDARLERRPVNPAIAAHPNYSLLHFTKTPKRPQGLSPEETYANRSNLVYVVPGRQRPH